MGRQRREAKKAPQPIPEIPNLGKLHKPRKGNRKAAKLIESGVWLWDQRHVERRARKRALKQLDSQEWMRRRKRVTASFVKDLLKRAPSWKLHELRQSTYIVPRSSKVEVEELIEAAKGLELSDPSLGSELPLAFLVAGLSYREHVRLRAELPVGLTSNFIYHERTATPENDRDFALHRYDPRVSGPLPEGEQAIGEREGSQEH